MELKFKEGVFGIVYDFEDGVLDVLREEISERMVELMCLYLKDRYVFVDIDELIDFVEGWEKEDIENEFGECLDVIQNDFKLEKKLFN